jgi:pimeloyl-ACP methyl ester carboxylesterase
MASFGLKVIRTLFGLGEALAPGLAGRAAFYLFSLTPRPSAMTTGERNAVERAADFMSEARHHRIRIRNACVVVHEFRPTQDAPTVGNVLVIHGWRSRTEYMAALIDGLRKSGLRVLSLDLPGHGQSPGRRLTLPMAVEAASLAGEWWGPFAAVVSHSFGGAVAVNAVAGSLPSIKPLKAHRLVLIAAPDSLVDVFDGFGRIIHLGRRSLQAMKDHVRRISGRNIEDFDGPHLLASLSVPTLVIHSPEDREVPAAAAQAYDEAGRHVELHWAAGLGHRRILADAAIVNRAVAFVHGEEAQAVSQPPSASAA